MNTLIMSDRVNQTLCDLWRAKARLLAEAGATAQDGAWIDKFLMEDEILQAWLDHREGVASGEDQTPDEEWAARAVRIKCSQGVWHHLLESGFERTLSSAPEAERAQVQREMAAVLLDADTLENLVDTIFSAEKLPTAWLKISAGADAIEPRVFLIETGEWLRVLTQAPSDGRRAGVEMEVVENQPRAGNELRNDKEKDLRVRVSGLQAYAGRTIDAALATLNSDAVFTALPMPKAYPVEQAQIDAAFLAQESSGPGPCGAGFILPPRPMPQRMATPAPTVDEWLKWRQRAEMRLDESRETRVDADGRCEFVMAISPQAEPLADKVLVIAVGNAARPEGSVSPPGPRGRRR